MVALITRDDLRAAIESKTITVVDALAANKWEQQHLPGALNLPYDLPQPQFVERASELLADREADIVVYCTNAACQASRKVAHRLQRLGYTRVRKYAGGIEDWITAGLPTEVAQPQRP